MKTDASNDRIYQDKTTVEEHSPELHEKVAESVRKPLEIRSGVLIGLFILASLYTLYFASEVFIPIVVALLLNFLLRPVIRMFKGFRIPPSVSSALVLLLFLGVLVVAVSALAQPATSWVDTIRSDLPRVELKVRRLMEPMRQLKEAADRVEKLADGNAPAKGDVKVQSTSVIDMLVERTWKFAILTALMFLLLYFILAYEDLFLRKLVRAFPRFSDKRRVLEIANAVEHKISNYLVTATLVNAAFGGIVGLLTYAVGLPNPLLWGVMAAFLEFIPYLGPFVGIVVVTVVSILTFDSLPYALLGPLIYLLLEIVEGNIVVPLIFSHRFSLNPVVVLVWLIFWSWLWGIAGALLAVPMLVTFKIFCDHIEPLAIVGEFIGN